MSAVSTPTGTWSRVHPVTPLARGWAILVILVLGLLRQTTEQLPQGGDSFALRHVAQILLGLLAVVLVVGFFSWLSWRVTAYMVDADSVHVRSGIVVKQHRRARLDRIQAIDLRQPLVARVLGLAELRVEVAGGGRSVLTIGYLTQQQAQALRKDLLERADAAPVVAGDGAEATATATDRAARPSTGELRVYEVPPGRLVIASLLRIESLILLVLVCVAVWGSIATGSPGVAFGLVPVLLGVGSQVFRRFNHGFAFRAAVSDDGIRLQHGLTETQAQTIPVHRVQAVELYQPWMWRPFDWWRVDVNVAGYGRGNDNRTPTTVLLPVGTRAEAVTALWLVLPDLGLENPREVVDEGLVGRGDSPTFTAAPRRSRWLDPVSWRRNGFAVVPRAVLARGGRLRRHLVVVPHSRTQSLGIAQGPWQRRFGLATFVLHSTPGAVSPAVPHLDEHVARALLDEQSRRARQARAHDDGLSSGARGHA